LGIVRSVMLAGGVGVAVGRNVWQEAEPLKATEKIKKIIFEE